MNKYDAFYHQSTILSPIRLTEPVREVELRIEEGEVCSEEQTDVPTRIIPRRFSFTTPVLPDHCVHLKVYAENQEVLGNTVKVADRVSHAVGMELGLQKCAIAHIKCGKVVDGETTCYQRSG